MTTLHSSISDLARSANVALTSAVDQALQYKQVGYAIKTWMLAMDWNLHAENNSAGGAISSATNIVYATPTNAHSWMTFERDGCYITFDFNNAAADTTPKAVTIVRGDVEPTGGTNTARPTAGAGNETTKDIDIIDWDAPVAGYISYVYSAAAGIGWFMVKDSGGDGTTNCAPLIVDAPVADDPMRDNSSSYGIWYGGTGWYFDSFEAQAMLTPNSDGSCEASASVRGYCDVWGLASELLADSATRIEPILWQGPNAVPSTAARVLGYSRLVAGTPYGTTWNASKATDLDDWVWRTIGGSTALLWYRTDGDVL